MSLDLIEQREDVTTREATETDALLGEKIGEKLFVKRREYVNVVGIALIWLGIMGGLTLYAFGRHEFKGTIQDCTKAARDEKFRNGLDWKWHRTGFEAMDELLCFHTKFFQLALKDRESRLPLGLLMNLWASWIMFAGVHATKSYYGYAGTVFYVLCLALGQIFGVGTIIPLLWCSVYVWTLGKGIGLRDRPVWIASSGSLVSWAICSGFMVVGRHHLAEHVWRFVWLPVMLPLIWSLAFHLPHTSHLFQMLGVRAARICHLLYTGMSLGWHLLTLVQWFQHKSGHGGIEVAKLLWVDLMFLWLGLLVIVWYESGIVVTARTGFISLVFGPGAALQSWRWLVEDNFSNEVREINSNEVRESV